jgi:hypothetical protein
VIRSRTDFFAAATVVTRVLAFGGATAFMVALSDTLERVNLSRAQLICSGALYATGNVERNTLDFVRYEQALVQESLERLRRSDPYGYAEQMRIANSAIARALRRRAAYASSALATFVRAAESCLLRLGRGIDFSMQSDRETLGEELARSARVGRAGATAVTPAHALSYLINPSACIAALTAGRAATRSWNARRLGNGDRSNLTVPAQLVTVKR